MCTRANNIVTVLHECLLFPHENGTQIESRTLRFSFCLSLTSASFAPVAASPKKIPKLSLEFFSMLFNYLPDSGRIMRKYLQAINQLKIVQLFLSFRI